ncbi:GH92 family glycosyl hydrolase [Barnesiella sp. An55]|uniref:GH92 family glycosyl hydrolase n=1 Tax=Barnesiella sp. An55 TaxID=1965646 RepID=UPI000B3A25FC|nr:GH92 family glycosyl hydrolase [Barnesiella sp. An55]OUN71907.1 alpha-mannosidase [Barnesiella sp. An55]HIZ26441.1 GH92 family glycosyl hydrolase [Candidatus Barnesiella merdipullorum]
MKRATLWLGLGLLLFSGCSNTSETQLQYSDFVNPFIGTGGHGHTFPGAVVPHGMIQPSPDTRIYEWDACSGYHYSDSTINGFSHTHLSGTGCGDYGDILLMPTVGKQDYQYLGAESQQTAYASPFSHSSEKATPGYYSVVLDRYHVKAELTATERAAMHRYHFPESQQAGFIVDLDYSLQGQENLDMKLNPLSDTEIVGWKRTKGWADSQPIGFYMKFSKPFTCHIVDTVIDITRNGKPYKLEQKKALLQFATTKDEEVLVKVGISAVDIDGARRNVESEIPNWDFDSIAMQAKEKWNNYLGTIEVETDNETLRQIFYTALYHTAIHPSLFSDADGRYRGLDQMIHQTKPGKEIYTVYSLWDTFRALHPLLTITQPELNDKLVMSLMEKYHEGGILPMWELAGNYTATMIGYHAVPVIVDAYMKGFNKIDGHELLKACIRSSVYDTTGIIAPSRMVNALVPISKYYKNQIGYIPHEKENESVAKGLEYAYNDWCIAQLAQAIGDTATYEKYKALSQSYANYYDAQTHFMRGKDLDGKWHTPFNPHASDHRNDDYCEGTAWQWTWFVPHDIDGLVSLMGGQEQFIGRLDSLFVADSKIEGDLVSSDISGLIGQYAHGNEPSHHIAHLYNYVNQSWKTQQIIDTILYTQYFDDPNGLSGNEDCGQMSAWYVLNAMGFYQVCPGSPIYSVGRPIFDKVTISLSNGKKFEIVANNNSRTNKYIQSIRLDNILLESPFFMHSDIMKGGRIVIEMGNTPVKQ